MRFCGVEAIYKWKHFHVYINYIYIYILLYYIVLYCIIFVPPYFISLYYNYNDNYSYNTLY